MSTEQERTAKVEDRRAAASRKASDFAELFGSPIGEVVLKEIKEQFDPPVLADGNTATIIRASQRDVVRWIEDVIERGKGNVER